MSDLIIVDSVVDSFSVLYPEGVFAILCSLKDRSVPKENQPNKNNYSDPEFYSIFQHPTVLFY